MISERFKGLPIIIAAGVAFLMIFAQVHAAENSSAAKDLAAEHNKKFLYFLNYGYGSIEERLNQGVGFDLDWQEQINYMNEQGLQCVDMMEAHAEDYADFKISPREYVERHFIIAGGHYQPIGNSFCAFAIKDKLLPMLEPKPDAYEVGFINSWEK